ncbi:MAG: hypothetical protein ACYC91_06735 [Solirubrobacteraceae bacterium]
MPTHTRFGRAALVGKRVTIAMVTALVALVAAYFAAISSANQVVDANSFNDIINPQWVMNTLTRAVTPTSAQQNVVPGAIASRDAAIAAYNAARKSGAAPASTYLAKPEYSVVWMGKANASDVSGKDAATFLRDGTINPEGLKEFANIQFAPGLDGFAVVDVRRYSLGANHKYSALNPDYGRVVNFVQLPLPWGVECEPHHMQYQFNPGDSIIAGCLFNSAIFAMNADNLPELPLGTVIGPQQLPLGSIPDAFVALPGPGHLFEGTDMGGPKFNFGGSPGSIVTLKDYGHGIVGVVKETPAGSPFGIFTGNANGVPEPCSLREARPLGTCANPHGVSFNSAAKTLTTSDYAEPRELVLDPVKTIDQYTFRPTVRTYSVDASGIPTLVSVAHMPASPLHRANRGHQNIGIMENGTTYGNSKAVFAGSMCGGGIFMNADVGASRGDASKDWVQVWDDGLSSLLATSDGSSGSSNGAKAEEPGGCAGGAFIFPSEDNRYLFRAVQGRTPLSTNFYDLGAPKMVYSTNIENLLRDAHLQSEGKGKVTCNINTSLIWNKIADGFRIGDCPTLAQTSVLTVDDATTGGPHFGDLDPYTLDSIGTPRRMSFTDYFVARTGVNGNHRMYVVNLTETGTNSNNRKLTLSYDTAFRDENTGALGVDFNRRDWPGSPDAGFFKPHLALWAAPLGVARDPYTTPNLP